MKNFIITIISILVILILCLIGRMQEDKVNFNTYTKVSELTAQNNYCSGYRHVEDNVYEVVVRSLDSDEIIWVGKCYGTNESDEIYSKFNKGRVK